MKTEDVRYISIEEIPQSELLKQFDNKPTLVFLIPLIIGILMLFGSWMLKGFGLLFIAFTVFVFYRIKKEKVVDVYEDFFIIYNNKLNNVTIIRWDEIKTWGIKLSESSEDRITIETNDGLYYQINMFGIGKVTKYFRLKAMDKNDHEQYKKQENQKGDSLVGLFKGKKK